jgi:prepilin-type N-terminal cleavage/methylation domain-containing protein
VKIKKSIQSQAGFTLLELLVVIAIIGLLAGVVMLGVASARVKARDAKRSGDMRQMITALEQYHITHGTYPTGSGSVASVGTGINLDDPTAMDFSIEPMIPNYIPMFPKAPGPADGSCQGTSGRGGNDYWYDVDDDGFSYTMTFCLGKNVSDWSEGVRYATPEGVR